MAWRLRFIIAPQAKGNARNGEVMIYAVIIYFIVAILVGGWFAADEKDAFTGAVCGVCWPVILMCLLISKMEK